MVYIECRQEGYLGHADCVFVSVSGDFKVIERRDPDGGLSYYSINRLIRWDYHPGVIYLNGLHMWSTLLVKASHGVGLCLRKYQI